MTAKEDIDFINRVADVIATRGRRRVLRRIRDGFPGWGSKTLAGALIIRRPEAARKRGIAKRNLYIPHYWAQYLHDGRGPVHPRSAKALVWFVRPKDDPRLTAGYPTRARPYPRLKMNRDDFYAKKKAGLLIVRASAGAMEYRNPFFSNLGRAGGMRGFAEEVTPLVYPLVSAYVRGTLRRERLLHVRGRVTIRI